MIWNKLKEVFASPTERTALAGAREGKVTLEGTIVAGEQELRSPIRGFACVAFYYRATWKAKSRDTEITRVHRQAECYAPFFLDLEDQRLTVVPPEGELFTEEDHARILGAGINGLEPAEQLVRAGDRARLHGRLHLGDRPWLELQRIEILEARPLERSAGNRKARRKQQRDERRQR